MFSLSLPLPFVRTSRRRRDRASVLQRARGIDARPWNAVLLAGLTVLTVGYLALTNENATAGYEFQALEERARALRDATRQLELQAIAAQSEERLASHIAERGFVPVASVRYLAADSAVAKR